MTLKKSVFLAAIFAVATVLPLSAPAQAGLNPKLSALIGRISQHYGRAVTITSGCRSVSGNRRAGGRKGSYHLRCMAADIKVAGVSEGSLLRFARALPGRGGVGTYCRNSVVHIDVGPRREWHEGCGRVYRKLVNKRRMMSTMAMKARKRR